MSVILLSQLKKQLKFEKCKTPEQVHLLLFYQYNRKLQTKLNFLILLSKRSIPFLKFCSYIRHLQVKASIINSLNLFKVLPPEFKYLKQDRFNPSKIFCIRLIKLTFNQAGSSFQNTLKLKAIKFQIQTKEMMKLLSLITTLREVYRKK